MIQLNLHMEDVCIRYILHVLMVVKGPVWSHLFPFILYMTLILWHLTYFIYFLVPAKDVAGGCNHMANSAIWKIIRPLKFCFATVETNMRAAIRSGSDTDGLLISGLGVGAI